MAEKRDAPLTEYVKSRVRMMQREGLALVHIEQDSGLSKGFLSLVLGDRSGVGPKTGHRMAKALGFGAYDELVTAAYDWWREQGKLSYEKIHQPEAHFDPEVARAVRGARAMNVSESAIAATLAQFAGITGKDFGWWIARISEHVQAVDHVAEGTARASKKAHTALVKKRRENRAVGEKHRAAKADEKTQEHRVIRRKSVG